MRIELFVGRLRDSTDLQVRLSAAARGLLRESAALDGPDLHFVVRMPLRDDGLASSRHLGLAWLPLPSTLARAEVFCALSV